MSFFATLTVNIFSGLLGAGIVWCLGAVKRSHRERIEQRQFPAGGTFVSRYEDEIDGNIVIQKAVAKFEQRGLRLMGCTTNLSENRTWHIRLTVEDSRFIHGVYGHEDPRDNSSGVIFLELLPDGSLEGIWAGYDSHNKRVQGGKYWFKRVLNYDVIPLSNDKRSVSSALDILSSCLGARYIEREDLESYIASNENESITGVALVAKESTAGAIIGVVLAESVDEERLRDSFHGHYVSVHNSPAIYQVRSQTAGLIKCVAVDHAYREKGVATEMIRKATVQMAERGTRAFYAFGWRF